jgi:hypothetical protein
LGGIYTTRWRKENAALGPEYFLNILNSQKRNQKKKQAFLAQSKNYRVKGEWNKHTIDSAW